MMMAKYNNIKRAAGKQDQQQNTLPVTDMPGIDFEEVHVRAN